MATSDIARGMGRVVAWGLAFGTAVVVLGAGVGLAIPHLRADGLVVETWLGMAAVVLGVAGAGLASWRILSSVRSRWWLLAVPVLLVTTYVALWTVGQGVAAGLPGHPELGSRTPTDVGLAYRDVTLPTSDGATLAAWWVPAENGAAVALLHGAGSTRTAVLDEAAVLGRHGYGVLLLDARGHGESGGDAMDFGWYGERDAAAAVDFMAGEPGVEHVGLVGLSMGGEEAIGAAGADSRVRAVVAEGATNRVAEDKAFLAEAYGVRGSVQQHIDWFTYAVAGLLSDAPQPEPLRDSVVAAQEDGTPTPILLITAGDVTTEQLAADHLVAAAPAEVDTWTVPDAGHLQGLSEQPEEWERRVTSFLDGALLPRPDAPAPR